MLSMMAECPFNLCILRNTQAAEVTVDLPWTLEVRLKLQL